MWSEIRIAGPLAAMIAIATSAVAVNPASAGERYGFGRAATAAEIAALDIDVRPDGQGLPIGRGSVAEGARLFAERCQSCHLEGGTKPQAEGFDVLVGGADLLKAKKPVRTIGNYWPEATTLFDYIRRAMPFDAPQSLTADEVYAVSAFLLARNGVVAADATLDQTSLPAVRMPARDGFVQRDDWRTSHLQSR